MKKLLLAAFLSAALIPLFGAFYFTGDADKNPLEYRCGETIVFRITPTEDGKPLAEAEIRWERVGDDGKKETGQAHFDGKEPLILRTSIDRPGFVYYTFNAFDRKGRKLGLPEYSISAGAEVEKLRAALPEPADFDAFWSGQQARLAALPMDNVKLTPVPQDDKSILSWQFELRAVTGGLCGYISLPKDAEAGSLKAEACFHGYGFGSVPTLSEKAAKEKLLVISVGRHGVRQGMPKEFYEEAKRGTLKDFAFRNNDNPAESDFIFMILRDLRAVEYLKSRPEWNGKDLEVSGGSMGALQALAVAAFDPAVTRLRAEIPWMADVGGVTMGRVGGWRPEYCPGLDYFDITFLAKRVKCPTDLIIGLGDRVCPASGQLILFNSLTVPRTLTATQSAGHRQPSPNSKVYKLEAGK